MKLHQMIRFQGNFTTCVLRHRHVVWIFDPQTCKLHRSHSAWSGCYGDALWGHLNDVTTSLANIVYNPSNIIAFISLLSSGSNIKAAVSEIFVTRRIKANEICKHAPIDAELLFISWNLKQQNWKNLQQFGQDSGCTFCQIRFVLSNRPSGFVNKRALMCGWLGYIFRNFSIQN